MSLTQRLALVALVPVAILVAVAVHHVRLVDGLVEDHRRLANVDLDLSRRAVALKADLARLDEVVAKASVLNDPEYAEEAARTERAIDARVAGLLEGEVDPDERSAVEAVAEAWRSRASPGATGPTRSALDRMLAAAAETAERRVASGRERAERGGDLSRAASILGVVTAAGLSALLGWSVARPIKRLRAATRDLADGDFARRVEPGGPPEVASLGEDFNAMAVRLGELDRLKDDLLSNVSHELKAPLASMRETVRLLLDGIPGPLTERQERLLGLTLESGERLSTLIDNLLDLSRLRAGAMGFEFEPHDLREVARSVVEPYEAMLRERDLDLDASWPEGAVPVTCDGPRVAQVVDNLVSNAVKFSPEGGTVRLRLERIDGGARLEVEDEGPGIPDGKKARVFERFYRADPARKGSQGTGLGLAIAREIARAHGGEVEVLDAPGGGSVFALELPRTPPGDS